MSAMLTTTDNEFDPYDDFMKWYFEDIRLNHKCCETLDRIYEMLRKKLKLKDSEMTDDEIVSLQEQAIDFIVLHDPTNLYKKIIK